LKEQWEEKICVQNIKYPEERNFIRSLFAFPSRPGGKRVPSVKRHFVLVLAPSQRNVSALSMLKFTLEQDMKAQKGSSRIAVLFL